MIPVLASRDKLIYGACLIRKPKVNEKPHIKNKVDGI